ncbi:hypothetical protein DVH24_042116 [Malus domestica]|uniref:AB hydrolase-1 domain-containing protein n=1 Tax=Malus domestica TaxID=3750 RepID=A0A498IP90_MALDO|nr:hypothetical protein DVH24_042116 [Malus domestica]
MASTSSPALSLSKLDFPLFSSQRKMQNLHQVKIPRRLSKFSGAKSNGFVLFSSLNGQTGETSPPSVEATTSVNNVSDVQVQSRYHIFSFSYSFVSWFCLVLQSRNTRSTCEVLRFRIWNWRSYSIRYQHAGNSGPALVLIHGFGANSDHWRKNLPVLSKSHRVYSIDLIGYGYSDKPNPRQFGETLFYTFETWASQLNDFCTDVVKGEAFFICNSIGGTDMSLYLSELYLLNDIKKDLTLRVLFMASHRTCRSSGSSYGATVMQGHNAFEYFSSYAAYYKAALVRETIDQILSELAESCCCDRNTAVGKYFFKTVATPQSVRNILSQQLSFQCYHDTSQVTEELVQKILLPGLEPGAVDVFLEFICYSGGPLPEELLPQLKCPVLIGWGDKDPWEPIELGREYGKFDSVEDFVVLPDVGHCPQDEAPDLVNPLIESFVARHAALPASISTTT